MNLKVGDRVRIAVSCRQILESGKVVDAKGRVGTVVKIGVNGVDVQLDDGRREDFTDKPMWFAGTEVEVIPPDNDALWRARGGWFA